MTAQQHLIEVEPEFDTTRLDLWEADFTPYPVVEQLFCYMRDQLDFTPRRMLDPSAGPGVYCQAARATWPDVEITAIEPRPEEHQYLRRWADVVSGKTFEQWVADAPPCFAPAIDLVATNPPFSRTAEFARAAIGPKASWTVLLGTLDWWQRGEKKLDDFLDKRLDQCLAYQLDIPGSIGFRGGSSGDAKSYAHWLWRPWESGPRWCTEILPRLPNAARQWRRRPGTEDTDATE